MQAHGELLPGEWRWPVAFYGRSLGREKEKAERGIGNKVVKVFLAACEHTV